MQDGDFLGQRANARFPLLRCAQAAAKLGLHPSRDWSALVANELMPQLIGLELEPLAEAWWGLGALGHDPGEEWVAAFTPALAAALGGAEAQQASGGARAASRIVITCARAGLAVPGGQRMLNLLVQRIVGPSKFFATEHSLSDSSRDGGSGDEKAPHRSLPFPAAAASIQERPAAAPVSRQRPASVVASTAAGRSSAASSHQQTGVDRRLDLPMAAAAGLMDLDAPQVLMLLEALVQLGYGSAGTLLETFVASAKRKR